jgi:hypothetical protein
MKGYGTVSLVKTPSFFIIGLLEHDRTIVNILTALLGESMFVDALFATGERWRN